MTVLVSFFFEFVDSRAAGAFGTAGTAGAEEAGAEEAEAEEAGAEEGAADGELPIEFY